MKINEVEHLENYLALWICIKGCIIREKDKDYTIDELKKLPRYYPNSGEVLKMMGLDIKEDKKMNKK